MNVLFAASEGLPFAMSGGLGDVAGSLPKAIRGQKVACRVVLPLYKCITESQREKMKFVMSFDVPVGWRKQYCGIFEGTFDGVKYYFIDNEYYFYRDAIYGYYDDAERYSFFSRAILEMILRIDFKPEIIHCNDWQTSLVPVFLDSLYRGYEDLSSTKTVFTIHNIQYQGKYGLDLIEEIMGIPNEYKNLVEFDGCANFMKGAIQCASKVTTVSPTYANEIQDPWFAHGLADIISENSYKLAGILNGIDYKNYNPESDPSIFATYSSKDFSKKPLNKAELREMLGLTVGDKPIVAMVTRLVAHKGLDLVTAVFDELIALGAQVVILGSGEEEYESFFTEKMHQYPGDVAAIIGFIPDVARKIYAGADIFLMPSKSEPCGLSQMVAARYGTIPVVRTTGGLADSISDCGTGDGNGFTFQSYNAHDMLFAVGRAVKLYADKENWSNLVKYAMEYDFTWRKFAKQYVEIYKEIL